VLIEKMRREGFELAICPPRVLTKEDPKVPGRKLEPFEEVVIDTDEQYMQNIIDRLQDRKGVLMEVQE
jgi:GTP-binding protein